MLVGITGKHELGSSELPLHLRSGMSANLFYENYAEGVLAAGMTPVFLPISSPPEQLAGHLDALLIAGGADIDPRLFGGTPVPRSTLIDPRRDAFERGLVLEMVRRGRPVLGVCRGHQLINAIHGGSLITDLPIGEGESHAFSGYPTHHRTHRVRIESGTALAAQAGEELMVNSFHHQAVDRVAPGFRPIAWADDGVVEAIEAVDRPVLGVQWHPEMLTEQPDPVFVWLAKTAAEHVR